MKINPKVVDISHYDNVHPGGFVELRNAGYLGVIGKASEGSGMVDKTYQLRRKAAQEAGLLYGAYHYMKKGDVKAQVDLFLDVVKPDNTILLAIDHEDRQVPLANTQKFCELIKQKVGYFPVLYSGFLIKEQLRSEDFKFWKQIRLWLSHYNKNPKWPNPPWLKPWLWQFTGDGVGPTPHTVPGITIDGGMDINSWDGTDEELKAQWVKG